MTTKTIARAAAAIAAAALALTGTVSQAQADDAAPLTYAQLQADPTTAAVQSQVTSLLAGDFTMGGSEYGAGGALVADQTIVHRGALYRTWIWQVGSSVVAISDGRQTCRRKATASAPNSYAGDLRARWTCRKGADTVIAPQVATLTPIGFAGALDSGSGGAVRFVPTALPGGGVQVDFSADGEPLGSYTFTSPADGSFTLTLTFGSGASEDQTLAFTTKAGATQRIPALSRLKK